MTKEQDQARWQRYHDGEMSPDEAAQADRELRRDPGARALLDSLETTDAHLKAALSQPLSEPLDPGRRQSIERIVAGLGAASNGKAPGFLGRWPRWAQPALAASLAAFILGLTSGYFAAGQQQEDLVAQLATLRQGDRAALTQAVADALETKVSGITVTWHNPDSGTSGSVTPTRTFRNRDGRWCREYERVVQGGGWKGGLALTSAGIERVIACREDEGRWQTRLIATTGS